MLYSAKEKADLANLVRIHINYNITYTQERNAEGQVLQQRHLKLPIFQFMVMVAQLVAHAWGLGIDRKHFLQPSETDPGASKYK